MWGRGVDGPIEDGLGFLNLVPRRRSFETSNGEIKLNLLRVPCVQIVTKVVNINKYTV